MRAIVHRHSVMMAVTAGTDSRTLLAASKDLQNKIYFFVNNHRLKDNDPDILVPRKMFESIGGQFHVHYVPDDIDEEFRRVFFDNVFLANERLLAPIYNVFFKNNPNKILVLGVGEIGRTFLGRNQRD